MSEVALAAIKPNAEIAQSGAIDIDLIKNTICKGSTDAELRLFLAVCRKTGLDPIAKQIYAVKRWDSKEQREVMAIQTGIDGYRLIAERSGKYLGQKGPYWSDGKLYPQYGENGNQIGENLRWLDAWPYANPPVLARVGVLRAGFTEPVWAVARYASYVQTMKSGQPSKFWAQMPDVMLGKCAESLAIRKAFPMETAGIYTREEMGQADRDEEARPAMIVAPKSDPELFDEAATAIGGAADIATLKAIWNRIYKDITHFSESEFADLERLKDNRKLALSTPSQPPAAPVTATAFDAVTPNDVDALIYHLHEFASDIEVESKLVAIGIKDQHAIYAATPKQLIGFHAALKAWLEQLESGGGPNMDDLR